MSTFTWLDHNSKTFVQAVLDWDKHRDTRALTAWLLERNHVVGNTQLLTLPLVESFVQGVNACPADVVRQSQLLSDWPHDSLAQTLPLREAMLNVPAWKNMIEDGWSENGLGILQLLYSTQEIKSKLASGAYSTLTESIRLSMGMPPMDAWWQRFALCPADEREKPGQYVWARLMENLVVNPHSMQGLRMALLRGPLIEAEQAQVSQGMDASMFRPPSIEDILESSIHAKEALALWTARHCPRDAVPEPSWWSSWDAWVAAEPKNAELALTTLLINEANAATNADNCEQRDGVIRRNLFRLASLREPPPTYALVHVMAENKKYQDWTVDQLLARALPGEQRGLHFFDGLTTHYEQLLMHYHKLLQPTEPTMEFDSREVGLLFDGP